MIQFQSEAVCSLADQTNKHAEAASSIRNLEAQVQLLAAERDALLEAQATIQENTLARSLESEQCARGMLEKEQLVSGALRLKLEGVNLQNNLAEAGKVKVKELREEVSLATTSVMVDLIRILLLLARTNSLGASLCAD